MELKYRLKSLKKSSITFIITSHLLVDMNRCLHLIFNIANILFVRTKLHIYRCILDFIGILHGMITYKG